MHACITTLTWSGLDLCELTIQTCLLFGIPVAFEEFLLALTFDFEQMGLGNHLNFSLNSLFL